MGGCRHRNFAKGVVILDFIVIAPSFTFYMYTLTVLHVNYNAELGTDSKSRQWTSIALISCQIGAVILHIFLIISACKLTDSVILKDDPKLAVRRGKYWWKAHILYNIINIALTISLPRLFVVDNFSICCFLFHSLNTLFQLLTLVGVYRYMKELSCLIIVNDDSSCYENPINTGVGYGQLMSSFGRNKAVTIRQSALLLI